MKRIISLVALCLITVLGANAQYRGSYRGGYDRPGYQRVLPSRRFGGYHNGMNCPYVGLRIGPSFTNITDYEDSGLKTGVNVGLAAGFSLSSYVPLYLETGLYYTEKGSKNKSASTKLNYLELPFVFKYKAGVDGLFAFEPYIGGFASLGVGGMTKDLVEKTATSSFDNFNRGDAGLKIGCGVSFGLAYLDVNYDWGLANISKDDFHESHTSAITVNVGINF